jgi:hypothetical protein
MFINGFTHVAIDVASPTRMERYLKEVFGLQTLRAGWYRGEYIYVMGSPHYQKANPGIVELHLRNGIPCGELNHIGFSASIPLDAAVADLRQRGIYVDTAGGDLLYGPEDLRVQLDSLTEPRPIVDDSPLIKMQQLPVDPDLPCLVRGLDHIAIDIAAPTRLLDWLADTFKADGRREFARRGEFISSVYYTDSTPDPIGRRRGLMPIFFRGGIPRVRLNHIAFEMADAEGAIKVIESRGAKVDLGGDAMIHGPEDVWFQIDSRDTPYPVGHPANDPGVRLKDQIFV